MQDIKTLCGAVAIGLTFAAFIPYIVSIIKGRTRPHFISWVIWALCTLVVFAAQWLYGGGSGALVTGMSGLIAAFIAVLAYVRHADCTVHKLDWLCLAVVILSIPLWWLSSSPLWSVVLLTAMDLLGLIPTWRKTWHKPHDESLTFYNLIVLRSVFLIAALEQYSVITTLFSLATGLATLSFVVMLYARRAALKHTL